MALATLIPLLTPLIDQLIAHIPDPQARDKARKQAEQDLLGFIAQQQNAQSEINKIEAVHPKIFVSGWRPFIGWVCGASLAYTYIVAPFWSWVLVLWYPDVSLPALPTESLFELVLALLGLGGLRTYEKTKGVTR